MALILMYHAISPLAETAQSARFCCAPARFALHLRLLRALRHTVVALDDLVARIVARRPVPPRAVAITIDDGFRDAIEYALPLLRVAGVPATVFVATDFLSGCNAWMVREGYRERAMLSRDEVVRLHRGGLEVGAHSLSHPRLTQLSPHEAEREICGSKSVLESILGVPVRHFAYPYGDVSPRERDLARAAGFASACGVTAGRVGGASDLYDLRRLEICGWDHPLRFVTKLLRANASIRSRDTVLPSRAVS